MEDENRVTSSQESLPFSEETERFLMQEIDGSASNLIFDSQFNGGDLLQNWTFMEGICWNESVNYPDQKRPLSSIPASENWPGQFSFKVSFRRQENIRGATWIYSEEKNKLYVGKNTCCPVDFSTSAPIPEDVYIRAMALFSSPDHTSDIVKRCINHSKEEIENDIYEAEHLIRCDCGSASYEIDRFTGRHSVIVPFENPAEGQHFSCYPFKFMCFGSCSGGPNRRSLMIVFTLERRGEPIGRQRVDLKICACPVRDYKLDNRLQSQQQVESTQKESKCINTSSINPEAFLTSAEKPKIETGEENKNETYIIEVNNKKLYNFLKKMERYFVIYELIKHKKTSLLDVKQFLFSSTSSEDERY